MLLPFNWSQVLKSPISRFQDFIYWELGVWYASSPWSAARPRDSQDTILRPRPHVDHTTATKWYTSPSIYEYGLVNLLRLDNCNGIKWCVTGELLAKGRNNPLFQKLLLSLPFRLYFAIMTFSNILPPPLEPSSPENLLSRNEAWAKEVTDYDKEFLPTLDARQRPKVCAFIRNLLIWCDCRIHV